MKPYSAHERTSVLHESLVSPLLIAGVEKPFVIVNVTLTLVLVADLHMLGWLPLSVLAHMFLMHMTREDPFTRRIYIRYNRQADSYEPWPHARTLGRGRPSGFSKGVPC